MCTTVPGINGGIGTDVLCSMLCDVCWKEQGWAVPAMQGAPGRGKLSGVCWKVQGGAAPTMMGTAGSGGAVFPAQLGPVALRWVAPGACASPGGHGHSYPRPLFFPLHVLVHMY